MKCTDVRKVQLIVIITSLWPHKSVALCQNTTWILAINQWVMLRQKVAIVFDEMVHIRGPVPFRQNPNALALLFYQFQ